MNQLGIWCRPASKQKEVALEIQLGKCCSCPSIDSSGIELKKRDLHKTLFWKNPRPWGLSWGSKQMGLFVSLGGGHAAKRQLSHPALPLWAGSPTCYEAGVIREMNSTRGIFIGWTHGSAGGLLKSNIELWLQTGTVRGLGEEGAEGWVEGKQGSPKGGRTLLGRLLFPFGAAEKWIVGIVD